MRDEMLGAVVRRALEHPEFRERLMSDPREALAAHGFVLEDSDMHEIENLRAAGAGADVEQQLVALAEKIGVTPATS